MHVLGKLFQRTPTRDQFAAIVLKALAEVGFRDVTYSSDEFTLRTGQDVIFLDNAHANYCKASKPERKAIIQRVCATWRSRTEIPSDFDTARPFLLPLIRDVSYSDLVKLDLISKNVDISKFDCPTRPLFGSLVVGLAYDTEDSIQQVNVSTFSQWKVAFEDVLTEARDNLRDRTDPSSITEEVPGLYRGRWSDSYDSARILLTDLIYRVPVFGEHVAFVPNRDQLWIAGVRNDSALQAMLKIGEEAHFRPYPISPDLFVLSNGNWHVYRPDQPALLQLSDSLKRRREAVDYNQQKDALDAINSAQGVDVFVASYLIFEKGNGNRYSACVWSKGIDSLLPKTDRICFLVDKDSKNYISVQWEHAFPIVSGLMQDHGITPKRYRVRSFPNEEQLAKLRKLT